MIVRKKSKKFKPYVSSRNPDDPIKIEFIEIKDMTKIGLENWRQKTRPKVRRRTFNYLFGVRIKAEELSTKEKVANLVIDQIGYEGEFEIRGYSKGKNRFGVKQVRYFIVNVYDLKGELVARVIPTFRVKRCWWWND